MVDIAHLLVDSSIPIEKYGPAGKCHTINDPVFEVGILLLTLQRLVKDFPRSAGFGKNGAQEEMGLA
jgi:hypothetical protein